MQSRTDIHASNKHVSLGTGLMYDKNNKMKCCRSGCICSDSFISVGNTSMSERRTEGFCSVK